MIPTASDLHSDPLDVGFGELFNPPGLTNFLGTVQADHDPTGIRCLSFPPLFTGDAPTARLFLDGEYVAGSGARTTYTWRPDRLRRTTEHSGLHITCDTVAVVDRTAVVQIITVDNRSGQPRTFPLRLAVSGWVTRATQPIHAATPPAAVNRAEVLDGLDAVLHEDPDTGAACVQGLLDGAPDGPDTLATELTLDSGEVGSVAYVAAVGATRDAATDVFAAVARGPAAEVERSERAWDAELAAVVTPGNDRYSGHLPLLETDDDDLRRLYWNGILGVVYFKRESPHSVLGRTYDTLMPRYWPTLTYLWDYSLSSVVHAMLDPSVMRTQLEHWMTTDVHTCMATEWLTGGGLGEWYAVNDYAMCRMMHDYARWTDDAAWLDGEVAVGDDTALRPIDQLVAHARSWHRFESVNGLADYGGIGNLLECVSTYIHEVASLNAANVWCLRTAADHLEARGQLEEVASLRKEADELAARVQELYVDGQGYWNTRRDDGELVPVRHCYDLATVLFAMADDLDPGQRAEMSAFFRRELRTERWLRALSNHDPDAVFSVRADHQWNGAYCAWPAEVATGLYAVAEREDLATWVRGLARSANQGPFGQAHFAEPAVPTHAGGARKVPSEVPFINDWACSSGGAWVRLVIEGIMGVRAGLDGLSAEPALDGFDADTRLTGLPYQGRLYTVDAHGVRPE